MTDSNPPSENDFFTENNESGFVIDPDSPLQYQGEDSSCLRVMISDKHELSMDTYVSSVAAVVHDLLQVILSVFKRSRTAIYRTEQMVNQVDNTLQVLFDLNNSAEETNLLALNVFFDAAKTGLTGNEAALLAEEVKKLSEHSIQFSKDIKSEVGGAKKTINEVKELIGSTADKELESTLKTKAVIDAQISKLSTLEKLIITRNSLFPDGLPEEIHSPLKRHFQAYVVEESIEAVHQISLSLGMLSRRIHIIKSKQAATEKEMALLSPILSLCEKLQNACIK